MLHAPATSANEQNLVCELLYVFILHDLHFIPLVPDVSEGSGVSEGFRVPLKFSVSHSCSVAFGLFISIITEPKALYKITQGKINN